MNFKISSYIIHNNSVERKVLRKEIKNLIESLNINLKQISDQKIHNKNHSKLILIILNLKIILRKELFNLYHKRFLILNDLISYLKNIFYLGKRILKILFSSKSKNLESYNHNIIEKIVRDKHINAWKLFMKTDSDYMIIFEDDAICLENSKKRLREIFINLCIENRENIFCIDNLYPPAKSKKIFSPFSIDKLLKISCNLFFEFSRQIASSSKIII